MTTNDVLGLVDVHKVDGVILRSPPKQYSTLNYNNIIIALKNGFQPHGYLLAVLGDSNLYGTIPEDYDISILSQSVDFLLLETDNYFPSGENKLADQHAPLYKRPWDTKDETNVDYEVSQWINSGFPARKIIINIPLYGKSWKLSSNQINPPAPIEDKATPQYVLWSGLKESGYMAYLDICLVVKNRKWKVFQDPNQRMGPYAVSPNDPENNGMYWVGYDDVDMAVVKSKYVLSKELDGVYLGNYNFDISVDDFHNKCGGGRYPMLTAVHNTLTSSASKFNCLSIFISLLLLSINFLNF